MVSTSTSPLFKDGGKAACLVHILEQVFECDKSTSLYKSVLQHFGNDPTRFNVVDYFASEQTYFENLTFYEEVLENPKEKEVPSYLKNRCIHFKWFIEDKKLAGVDTNQESFYMRLTFDEFMDWKAEEMTKNVSSPRVTKSMDLIVDFKKGIKRDSFVFPVHKHIDTSPMHKCKTLADEIKEVPFISASIPTTPTVVLPREVEDTDNELCIDGDRVKKGDLEFDESCHPSNHMTMTSPPSSMFALDPVLQSFQRGHQAFSTVKLKTLPYGETGIDVNTCALEHAQCSFCGFSGDSSCYDNTGSRAW